MPETRDPQAVIAAAEQAALAGDYASAERLCATPLDLQEASLGPHHPELANTLNNLGVVYEVTEKPDEAERCFRRASTSPPRSWHPIIRSSPRAGRTSRTFCAARGIPVDAPAPAKSAEPQPIERPAIERRASGGCSTAHRHTDAGCRSAARRRCAARVPQPPLEKKALEQKAPATPTVAERPTRSLVVPGLVAAALIVAVVLGRMWFGSSEAPPRGIRARRISTGGKPSESHRRPSPPTTPPVSNRKEAPAVKPQPTKSAPAAADAPAVKGAPSVDQRPAVREPGHGRRRRMALRSGAQSGRTWPALLLHPAQV